MPASAGMTIPLLSRVMFPSFERFGSHAPLIAAFNCGIQVYPSPELCPMGYWIYR